MLFQVALIVVLVPALFALLLATGAAAQFSGLTINADSPILVDDKFLKQMMESTKAIAKLGEDRLKMSIAETMQAMRYSISEIDKLLSVSGEVLVDEVEAVINSMYRSDVKLYAHRVELQLLGHQSKLTTNRIISDLHKLQANGTDMDREQAVTSVLEGTLGLINDVSPSLDAIQKVFIEVHEDLTNCTTRLRQFKGGLEFLQAQNSYKQLDTITERLGQASPGCQSLVFVPFFGELLCPSSRTVVVDFKETLGNKIHVLNEVIRFLQYNFVPVLDDAGERLKRIASEQMRMNKWYVFMGELDIARNIAMGMPNDLAVADAFLSDNGRWKESYKKSLRQVNFVGHSFRNTENPFPVKSVPEANIAHFRTTWRDFAKDKIMSG